MKKKHYFSLTEFLIVMSILTILATLFFPSLKGLWVNSHIIGCTNNLKQISMVKHFYADDHDNFFVPIRGYLADKRRYDWDAIMDKLELYPIFNKAALCPTNPKYGLNQTTHGGNKRVTIDKPIHRERLIAPSEKIQGGDCTSNITYRKRTNPEQPQGWLLYEERAIRSFGYRHLDQANVFYFDGHVDLFDMYLFDNLQDRLRYSKGSF